MHLSASQHNVIYIILFLLFKMIEKLRKKSYNRNYHYFTFSKSFYFLFLTVSDETCFFAIIGLFVYPMCFLSIIQFIDYTSKEF